VDPPALPELEVGVPAEVTVTTLGGPLTVGLLLGHDAGAEAPVIVTHHGNNERAFDLGRRSKNFLNRALLEPTPPAATLVLLRAPFHAGSLREYTAASGDLRTWMGMLAASVSTMDAVVDRYGRAGGVPTILTGSSLGGWVVNLHRAFRNSADLYVPMLAGAHLGRQLVESTYRWMVSREALRHADELRALLDFEVPFTVTDRNVAPLLARYDQYARLDHQLGGYGDTPVALLDTGHVGAALASAALRGHVVRQLERLRGPSAHPA
jgi:hypothetical protein